MPNTEALHVEHARRARVDTHKMGAGYPMLGLETVSVVASLAKTWDRASLQHGNRALQNPAPLAPLIQNPWTP